MQAFEADLIHSSRYHYLLIISTAVHSKSDRYIQTYTYVSTFPADMWHLTSTLFFIWR